MIRKISVFITCLILGLLGNILNFEMFFGVNQIFGSIFVLIAVWYFGPGIGVISAILVHSYTIYLWGHPYAFIAFVLEAFTVGMLLRMKIKNIFIADIIYWTLIGIWLVPLFYGHIMELPETQVILIMLKHPANGLLNALVSTLLVLAIIKYRINPDKIKETISLRNLLFTIMMTMVSFSLFFSAHMMSNKTFERFNNDAIKSVEDIGNNMRSEINEFINMYNTETLKLTYFHFNKKSNIDIADSSDIESIWMINKDTVTNIAKKEIIYHLPVDDKIMCDVIPKMWIEQDYIYSSQMDQKSCLISVIKKSTLQNYLANHSIHKEIAVHVLDKKDRLILSSINDKSQPFHGIKTKINDNTFHVLPNEAMPKMLKWKKSHFVYLIDNLPGFPYKIIIQEKLSSSVDALQRIYIYAFIIMLSIIAIVVVISYFSSRSLLSSLESLSLATLNLPHKIEQNESLSLPTSSIKEIMSFSNNFSILSNTLQNIIKDSEQRYNKLFENSKDAMLVINLPNLKVIDSNKKAQGLLSDLLMQSDTIYFKELFFKCLKSDINYYRENTKETYWLLVNGGSRLPVHLDKQYINYKNQEIVLVGIHDVTAEIKFKEQMQLISKVFETTSEGIMITDEKANIIMVNSGFTSITGYKSEEVIGQNPNVLHSDWQEKDFYKKMWSIIKKEGKWEGELWNRRKNGELFAEWISIYKVLDEDGNLSNYIGVFSDVTEKMEAQKKINQLAYYDVLTGLPNRQLFQDRITHAITMSERNNTKTALMFIDLDNFKTINDTMGHQTGDLFLKELSERLSSIIRESDTLARISGDEFTVIIEGIKDKEQVVSISKAIQNQINKPIKLGVNEIQTSASIGVSFYPDDAINTEQLMSYADTAMYRAKENGKKSIEFFTAKMNEEAMQQLQIENGLKQALAKDKLQLFYQPQVTQEGAKIIGVEALIRWNDPEKGFISPELFIPIAERTGLMGEIEAWVIKTATKQQRMWQEKDINITMSINISNYEFRKPQFVKHIIEAIQCEGLDCKSFDLELTERVVMDTTESFQKIAELKKAGFIISLDDFGTGQSSLSYIKRFNIDKLKIDKSFVDDIPDDAQSCDIVQAIISLAKAMKMETVAEGIEDKRQIKFLKELGCGYFQGYYYSKPLPVEELEARYFNN
ncbi:MAG: EAL domain-containing protein [Gammaproteobacteria bacterium]|nr:EAL domain-containing protein [Gammaproteobacteria bacterium]